MDATATTLLLASGAFAMAGGLLRECWWCLRWRGPLVEGMVIGHTRHDDSEGRSYHPEIEYPHGTARRRFVSRHGKLEPLRAGSTVRVRISASQGDAEWHTGMHRWFFTIFPIAFGLLLVLLGAGMKPS